MKTEDVHYSQWICLLSVTGSPDHPNLLGCPGAYVTVITMASDYDECVSRVQADARAIGLEVDDIVWCETLEDRLARYDIEDYLLQHAKATRVDHATRFGVFHAWENED